MNPVLVTASGKQRRLGLLMRQCIMSAPRRLFVETSVALAILSSAFLLWRVLGPTAAPVSAQDSGVVHLLNADSGVTLKEHICNLAGPACIHLKGIYWNVLGLRDWLYLVPAVLVALAVFLVDSKRLGERPTFSRFSHFCFPKSLLSHKSAKVDYKYYLTLLVTSPLMPSLSMVIPSAVIAGSLAGLFGVLTSIDPTATLSATWIDKVLYTILLVMAGDLGSFIYHYLVHKIPLLWEFHKVHHSAQVLVMPFTASRIHPIDGVLQGLFVGLMLAVVNGIYAIVYSQRITELTIYDVSAITFFYHVTSNLRHSHIPLHYGWTLSHLFSSPAQHQIHHSKEARHIDKNFGLVFSLWDWMVGTLYIPQGKEQFAIGLHGPEGEEYQSVLQCYLRPFSNIARQLSEARSKIVPI